MFKALCHVGVKHKQRPREREAGERYYNCECWRQTLVENEVEFGPGAEEREDA